MPALDRGAPIRWLLILLAVLGAGCKPTAGRPTTAPATPPDTASTPPALRYWLVTRAAPRPLRIHHLRVDLHDPRIELVASLAPDPDGAGPATARLMPPVALARQAGALALINANPWQALPDAHGRRSTNWREGMPVEVLGLAGTQGHLRHAPEDPAHCSVWVDGQGQVHLGRPGPQDHVAEGVAGFLRLLERGRILPGPGGPIHPRTALGLDATGQQLSLVVVDGRQPGYSEGMSYGELAAYMRELGCQEAVNLDGGGSSLMLLAEGSGQYRVVNDPSTKVAGVSVPRPIPVALVVRSRRAKPPAP